MKKKENTRANKLVASIMILTGIISALISDGTYLVFTLFFGIPLFFAKKNWIDL